MNLAAGFSARGIDQDLKIKGDGQIFAFPDATQQFRYKETLDTTYLGGFVSIVGELPFGIPGTKGLWERLGLRTFYELRAGVYNAHTDYNGRYDSLFEAPGLVPLEGAVKLDLSEDKAAFIGGIKFNTVKQIGPRTSLSLLSEYEWYSNVPEMRYNDSVGSFIPGNNGTRIGSDDAFSSRTSLRLNIGLGPAALYPPR